MYIGFFENGDTMKISYIKEFLALAERCNYNKASNKLCLSSFLRVLFLFINSNFLFLYLE